MKSYSEPSESLLEPTAPTVRYWVLLHVSLLLAVLLKAYSETCEGTYHQRH